METKKDQIAMWRKYDKNGREYYSVQVEIQGVKHSFSAFQNNKSNDKQPDFKGDVYKPRALPDGWGEKKDTRAIINKEGKPSYPEKQDYTLMDEESVPF